MRNLTKLECDILLYCKQVLIFNNKKRVGNYEGEVLWGKC